MAVKIFTLLYPLHVRLKSVKEEQEALLGEDSCANEDTNESG